MRIVVFPGVLRPPSDTALLGGVMARHDLAGRTVLDLCTGTGILGLTAARLGARATAVDLSRRAVICGRVNARLNRLPLEVLRGDLFAPVAGRRFDLIVSNPPYIPAPPGDAPRGEARAWDAGPDGREFLDRICERAAEHLNPGGRVLLVHSSLARPEETERRLAAHGLDRASRPSTTGAWAPSRASGWATCARSASSTRRRASGWSWSRAGPGRSPVLEPVL